MKASDIQPWLFRVEAFEGESLSHFLGRFRRANEMTPSGLAKAAGLGGAIARWEKFRLNPPPSRQQLEALALVVVVEADRLVQMLPLTGWVERSTIGDVTQVLGDSNPPITGWVERSQSTRIMTQRSPG